MTSVIKVNKHKYLVDETIYSTVELADIMKKSFNTIQYIDESLRSSGNEVVFVSSSYDQERHVLISNSNQETLISDVRLIRKSTDAPKYSEDYLRFYERSNFYQLLANVAAISLEILIMIIAFLSLIVMSNEMFHFTATNFLLSIVVSATVAFSIVVKLKLRKQIFEYLFKTR